MSSDINRRTAVKALGAGLLAGGSVPFIHVQSYGQNQPTKVSLTLPFTLHGSYTAFIAARDLGYWKDRGVDVAVSRGYGSPDAIKKWRSLMGATDPAKAEAGTLRKEFAESIERNVTHGSDAPDTAAYEIGYFFAGVELT